MRPQGPGLASGWLRPCEGVSAAEPQIMVV